jgi:glycosyltransferase involved in cell wall biosynthesis
MRGARAVVSMAHNESFGLTPIESFAVGTPALFVDEGGFRDTIIDGVNGRLLPREDLQSWHKALIESSEEKTRRRWAEAGRQRISELDLSPQAHARRIYELITDS